MIYLEGTVWGKESERICYMHWCTPQMAGAWIGTNIGCWHWRLQIDLIGQSASPYNFDLKKKTSIYLFIWKADLNRDLSCAGSPLGQLQWPVLGCAEATYFIWVTHVSIIAQVPNLKHPLPSQVLFQGAIFEVEWPGPEPLPVWDDPVVPQMPAITFSFIMLHS